MTLPIPGQKLAEDLRAGGFRKFILRGNVVDLAIGIVIGAAFKSVIDALVADFITPLVNIALPHNTAFADRYVMFLGSKFGWGNFVNQVLSFVILAAVVYYFVMVPVNILMERFKTEPDVTTPTRDCPECRSAIPADATRCAFCTVQVPPVDEQATARTT